MAPPTVCNPVNGWRAGVGVMIFYIYDAWSRQNEIITTNRQTDW